VAWFNVYGSFRQIIQDLVAPTLEAIQGDIRALNARIDSVNAGLNAKIDSVNSTLSTKIDSLEATLNGKIDSVETTLNARINSVESPLGAKIDGVRTDVQGLRGELHDLRLDVRQKWEESLAVHERLAAIEAKLEIR